MKNIKLKFIVYKYTNIYKHKVQFLMKIKLKQPPEYRYPKYAQQNKQKQLIKYQSRFSQNNIWLKNRSMSMNFTEFRQKYNKKQDQIQQQFANQSAKVSNKANISAKYRRQIYTSRISHNSIQRQTEQLVNPQNVIYTHRKKPYTNPISYHSYYQKQIQKQIKNSINNIQNKLTNNLFTNTSSQISGNSPTKMLKISQMKPTDIIDLNQQRKKNNKKCQCKHKSQQKVSREIAKLRDERVQKIQKIKKNNQKDYQMIIKIGNKQMKKIVQASFIYPRIDTLRSKSHQNKRKTIIKSLNKMEESWKIDSWQVNSQINSNSKMLLDIPTDKNYI